MVLNLLIFSSGSNTGVPTIQTIAFITILSTISPSLAMAEISPKAKLNSSIRANSTAQAGDTLINQQAYILRPGDEIQLTMFGQPQGYFIQK